MSEKLKVHLSHSFETRSAKFKVAVQNSKLTNYLRWYYLTVAIMTFIIFLLTLPKGDTIAQEKLSDPGVNLITQNDSFERIKPEDLELAFPKYTPAPKLPDQRLVILKKYLAQFNSPLKEHAEDFLAASDTYGVDWRLVPSIAGVESTFGKRIPGGHDPDSTSYNGWGWGVYGDKLIKFDSWRQAIFAVTKGLKIGYIDKGLTDPFSMNKKYASSPFWAGSLTFFLEDLDDFATQNSPKLTSPEKVQDTFMQNYAYLKNEETHFSLQFSE